MKIFLERDKTTKKINFSGTVKELLKKLKINPETVLVLKSNEVLTEEENLQNHDSLEIISVVSGG